MRILDGDADTGTWKNLAESYDEMSGIWTEWASEQFDYVSPVRQGLKFAKPASWALEVSCGTGQATGVIAESVPRVIATDVNESMIERAPRIHGVTYSLMDVRALPLDDRSVPLCVGLNAVLYPPEISRVLMDGGQVLWCSSFGPGTPIYVSPQDVIDHFGAGFVGEAGRSGHGDWVLLTKKK
ncbi:class I SAM-dependent methyltransferase [Actinocorallia lasiicapitis]